MRNAFAWVLLLTLMTAVTAQAQEAPAGRWWHSQQVVNQLQLTPEEIQQLDQSYEASRLKMIRLKSQVEAEQFKLQAMVERQNLDDGAIKAQHRTLEEARTQLADERFAFFVEVRQIIGPDRFQRLLDMAPQGRRSLK